MHWQHHLSHEDSHPHTDHTNILSKALCLDSKSRSKQKKHNHRMNGWETWVKSGRQILCMYIYIYIYIYIYVHDNKSDLNLNLNMTCDSFRARMKNAAPFILFLISQGCMNYLLIVQVICIYRVISQNGFFKCKLIHSHQMQMLFGKKIYILFSPQA